MADSVPPERILVFLLERQNRGPTGRQLAAQPPDYPKWLPVGEHSVASNRPLEPVVTVPRMPESGCASGIDSAGD